ncbi:hypothetical protein Clacol_003714 [Clathrus columnatus]|uniref:Prenylcysteine lyase domain-containing protein n=1 Tax=Clathrus columnatus TaxID=1419009 RepID=A0AAV5A8Z4_9AGAM|nr:hypothetical protein Clacol_003714 [Clathrus columnatus]
MLLTSYLAILVSILPSISVTNSFQLPLQFPFFQSALKSDSVAHRVAIIGAGAGGSSAAYWLSRAADRHPEIVNLQVDVFEKESYVGGRSTIVHPHNSNVYDGVELGASLFVPTNKNLHRAVKEFNLSLISFEDENGEMGIWDGKSFRFRITQRNGSYSWWDMLRMLFRYGLTTSKNAQALVDQAMNSFLNVYDTAFPEWTTVSDLASSLNLTDLTGQTIGTYMIEKGISKIYIDEIVEGNRLRRLIMCSILESLSPACTRVNYAHNVTDIHAIEGLVSQATNGAGGVQGGNYQIFQEFLTRSSATTYLKIAVTHLVRKENTWVLTTSSGESRVYDSVILATPYHHSGISITPLIESIPQQTYVHLYVTLLATGLPNPRPEYFSLDPNALSPSTILTTNVNFREGGIPPEFVSLTYHGHVKGQDGRPDEYIVKIFSLQPIKNEFLRKWDAYPLLPSNVTYAPVVPAEGLYYVNSFEPFISTMETETVSKSDFLGKSVADVRLRFLHRTWPAYCSRNYMAQV